MSNIHIVGERLCRNKRLACNIGNWVDRAAIHVVFIVLERLALDDGDLFFIVTKRVAARLDEVGAVCPAKGDVSVLAVDAIVASGRDRVAAYRDTSIPAVDAVTVCASGLDCAADYRDSVITVDAAA